MLRRNLDGVRFCIYADKSNPWNVLEAYTFSFNYSNNGLGTHQKLVGIGFSNDDRPPVSIGGARSSLENFMNRLHHFDQNLPDLPGRPLYGNSDYR